MLNSVDGLPDFHAIALSEKSVLTNISANDYSSSGGVTAVLGQGGCLGCHDQGNGLGQLTPKLKGSLG